MAADDKMQQLLLQKEELAARLQHLGEQTQARLQRLADRLKTLSSEVIADVERYGREVAKKVREEGVDARREGPEEGPQVDLAWRSCHGPELLARIGERFKKAIAELKGAPGCPEMCVYCR